MKKQILLVVLSMLLTLPLSAKVKITVKQNTPQTNYAAGLLKDISGDYTI